MDAQWNTCLAHFLVSVYDRSHSEQTRRAYRANLATFFCDTSRNPDQYSRADVEAYLHRPLLRTRHAGQPPATSTINTRLVALRSFYHYAGGYLVVGEGGRLTPLLRSLPPTSGIKPGKTTRSHRGLSYEEMERLFAVIPSETVRGARDRAMFLCFFWTARRRNEILTMRYGDIEQATLADQRGAVRTGWVYSFAGKGQAGERDRAELPAPAKEAIDHYLRVSGRDRTIGPTDPLFIGMAPQHGGGYAHVGVNPIAPSSVLLSLRQYGRLAGLDVTRLVLHSWRHTAVHARYEAGSDIREIQHLLRHSNIATTDIYLAHLVGSADPGAKLLYDRFAHFSQPQG